MGKSIAQEVDSAHVTQLEASNQNPSSSTANDVKIESHVVKKYLGDSEAYTSEEDSDNVNLTDDHERKVGSIMRSDIVSSAPSVNRLNLSNFDALKILNELDVGPYNHKDGFNTIDEFEKYLVKEHFDLAQRICELDEAPTGPSKRQQQRDRVERLKKMTAAVNRTVFEPKAKLPKGRYSSRPTTRNFNK